MECLVLEVDGTRFGIPTVDVREVVRAVSLGDAPARLPNMMGMLNYRGQVLGVLELACLRARPHRELTPHEHLIILQVRGHLFALRVDQAIEIMTWTDGDEPTSKPGSVGDPVDDTLTAIAHPRLGLVSLLDTSELWSELHVEQGHQPTEEVEAS